MLVEEFDPSLIDALGNLLADLVRGTPFNHIQPRPSILRLGARRSADEQRVLELPLQVVLLHMVGKGRRNLPKHLDQLRVVLSDELRFNCLLGIPDTREA